MTWLRILAPVLIYLACTLAAGLLGYRIAERDADLELTSLRLEHAEAVRLSTEQAAKALQAEQQRADALAAQLAEQQREHRTTRDQLQKEVTRVSTLYRKALDAAPEPVPACVFTRGWVRLYDRATGAELPAAPADPAGAAAPAAEAAAAEQLDSGVSQAGLLAHHIDYAEQCRNSAAQLDRLIDLLEAR
jgi:hypothetical protein